MHSRCSFVNVAVTLIYSSLLAVKFSKHFKGINSVNVKIDMLTTG